MNVKKLDTTFVNLKFLFDFYSNFGVPHNL